MPKKQPGPTLYEVKITGRNFKSFTNPVVYLDEKLKTEFEAKGKDGQTRLQKLENGMAIRGFKHLYEMTVVAKKCSRLVLSASASKSDGGDLYVNVEEYSKYGQAKFMGLYRETGNSVAGGYLSSALPAEFPPAATGLSESEAKKASANVGDVIGRSTKSAKGVGAVAKATSEALKAARKEGLELKKENADLRGLLNASKLHVYERDLQEFKDRLTKQFKETSGKNNWQEWFRNHSWVLGPNYLEPIEKSKVGFEQIPDFILPTLDGFADILELKLPAHAVIRSDSSHPGSVFWTPDAAKAIGQASNYIHEAEDNRLKLKEKMSEALGIELAFVRPRAFVIIGVETDWDDKQRKMFRHLRATLHGIEVLTYNDIARRAEAIIKMIAE